MIVDLLDGAVAIALRDDSALSKKRNRADVRHVLQVAARNHRELKALWEVHHGQD